MRKKSLCEIAFGRFSNFIVVLVLSRFLFEKCFRFDILFRN